MRPNERRYFLAFLSRSSRPPQFKFFFVPTRPCVLILLFAFSVFTQDLPGEIRGYKVYRARVEVQNEFSEKTSKQPDALVNLGSPAPVGVWTTGLTFELPGELLTLKQSGEVHFLAFKDFRVNGLEIEIPDYNHPFAFEKNQTLKLPQPIKVSLGFTGAARAAWLEWRDSKPLWQVTGRVFVFGRFRKAGFKFKRVVPIDIDLQIRNPVSSER